MVGSPKLSQLPPSTIDMLMAEHGEPYPVARATAWADRVLELDIDPESVVGVYALEDGDGHACALLVPSMLAAVGAWRETRQERIALARDFSVAAVLAEQITPSEFSRFGLQIAIEVSSLRDEGVLSDPRAASSDLAALYQIEHVIDEISHARSTGTLDEASYRSSGIEPDNLLPWLVAVLQKNGMVDATGALVPASWAS